MCKRGSFRDTVTLQNTFGRQPAITMDQFHVVHERFNASSLGLHDSSAPILNIPNEILAYILGMVDHAARSTKQLPDLVVMTHVTRHWRAVALDNASLWSSIYASPFHPPLIIVAYLSRSQAAPLNITYEFPDQGYEFDITPTWGLFWTHSQRWRTLEVRSRNAQIPVETLVRSLGSLAVPRLQSFILNVDSAEDDDMDDDDDDWIEWWQGPEGQIIPIFMGGAPVLASLEVRGISMTWCYPPLKQLTTLDLYVEMYGDPMRYQDFCEILSGLQRLTQLFVCGRIVDADHRDHIPTPICIPSLLYLQIIDEGWLENDKHIRTLFITIVAPALEVLVLASDGTESHTRAFIEITRNGSAYPNLRMLRLVDCHANRITVEFMRSTPKLKDVMLVGMENTQHIMHTLCEGGGSAWPSLTSLTVHHLYPDYIRKLVAARIAVNRPLIELCIPSQLEEKIPEDDLDWLRRNIKLTGVLDPRDM